MKLHYTHTSSFILESGEKLDQLNIAFSDYGPRQADRIIWVCHALSGSSEVLSWWPGLFGPGKIFDPQKDRIICANVLGSCYGTSGPSDLDKPLEFPFLTIKDMVNAHQLLADHLGLKKIDLLIGASLGGQQALEWTLINPDFFESLILIATNAFHSPYGRAFNEVQRMALQADQTFGQKNGGLPGLKAARAIAMLSYRSYDDFSLKQADSGNEADHFRAPAYVQYQGEKFLSRFNPYAYFYLSKAMDSHDILRGRTGGYCGVLKTISAKTLVVGIDSDTLFPVSEQEFLAANIPQACLRIIRSQHGHDSFLIDYDKLNEIISAFVGSRISRPKPTSLKRKIQYSYN